MKKMVRNFNNFNVLLFILVTCPVIVFTSIFFNNGIFVTYSENPIIDFFKVFILSIFLIYLLYILANKKIVLIALLAFYLRLFSAFIISFTGIIPYAFDIDWDVISYSLIKDWKEGNLHFDFEASSNVRYYTILTTLIYTFFGYNPIYMQILNVFFGAIAVIYVYKIGTLLFNERIGKFCALIMCVWPTHIMFSSMQMRDSLATLLLVLFIYYFILWFDLGSKRLLMISFLIFIGNILIRQQNAALILATLFPFVIIKILKRTNKLLWPVIILMVASAGLAIVFLLNNIGFLAKVNLEYIIREAEYRSSGGSAYLTWMTYSNWFDIIKYAPLRLFYFIYSPFPWQVTSITQGLALMESFVLIVFSVYILVHFRLLIKNCAKKYLLLFLITFCLIGLTANAVIDSNVGTAIRHKLQYLYIIFVLFAAVYVNKKELKKSQKNKWGVN